MQFIKLLFYGQPIKDLRNLCLLQSCEAILFSLFKTFAFELHPSGIEFVFGGRQVRLHIFPIYISTGPSSVYWEKTIFQGTLLPLLETTQSYIYICWIWFWILFSVPLVSISMLAPKPGSLKYYSFIISLNDQLYKSSFCSRPFSFPYEFQNGFVSFPVPHPQDYVESIE